MNNSSIFPVLEPASPQADAINGLFIQVLILSAAIFLTMTGLIVYAMIRFRDRGNGDPKQTFGSDKAEMAWMVGPILVLIWLAVISVKLVLTINALPEAHPAGGQDADLVITGHQWWWEVRYLKADVVEANEIHIPVGKKVRLKLNSADVIHGFWAPRLARKIDVFPKRDNYIWLEADTPGVYQGRCTEYCGAQHAWMTFKVYAHPQAEYDDWLKQHERLPADPTDPQAKAGKEFFFSKTCVACHEIKGTPAEASIGPSLTHFALREYLAGGLLKNTRANVARWLADPQAVKPGCKMPDFRLTAKQQNEVAAYLETLK